MTYNDGKHPKQCRVHMEGIEEEIGPKVVIEQITKGETRARKQQEAKDPDPDCGWLLVLWGLQREILQQAQNAQQQIVGDEAYIREGVFVVLHRLRDGRSRDTFTLAEAGVP